MESSANVPACKSFFKPNITTELKSLLKHLPFDKKIQSYAKQRDYQLLIWELREKNYKVEAAQVELFISDIFKKSANFKGPFKISKLGISFGKPNIKIYNSDLISVVRQGESARFEFAAHMVDKILGLNIVPFTTFYIKGSQMYSAQLFVNKSVEAVDFKKPFPVEAVEKLKLLSYLLKNTDLHTSNYLFSTRDPSKLILIDNENIMGKQGSVPITTLSDIYFVDKNTLNKIPELTKDKVEILFGYLVSKNQISLFLERVKAVEKKFSTN